jgi:hypothetical protein
MSAMGIALRDAEINCERDGGEAVLTLRSGKEVRGRLERGVNTTAHLKTVGGGWSTVLIEEIAAVSVVRKS